MKSEIDKKLDRLADQYLELFGEPYPMMITDTTSLEEHVRIMERCIETGEKAEEPEYEEGADY